MGYGPWITDAFAYRRARNAKTKRVFLEAPAMRGNAWAELCTMEYLNVSHRIVISQKYHGYSNFYCTSRDVSSILGISHRVKYIWRLAQLPIR